MATFFCGVIEEIQRNSGKNLCLLTPIFPDIVSESEPKINVFQFLLDLREEFATNARTRVQCVQKTLDALEHPLKYFYPSCLVPEENKLVLAGWQTGILEGLAQRLAMLINDDSEEVLDVFDGCVEWYRDAASRWEADC